MQDTLILHIQCLQWFVSFYLMFHKLVTLVYHLRIEISVKDMTPSKIWALCNSNIVLEIPILSHK